jgi:alcohol dehydrogenase, propanol-preferring
MHDFDDGAVPWNPGFTLGHENAGWVDSIGDGVTAVKEGDAVAVYGPRGCGKCARCQLGIETYREDPAAAPVASGGGGLGLDGGMADYMLVPSERLLVHLPSNLDPATAAPLTDAGLTPYHAVRRSWTKMTPEATVVVIGVGGLGHLAVQIVKTTTSASVSAIDTKSVALDLAKATVRCRLVCAGGSQRLDRREGRRVRPRLCRSKRNNHIHEPRMM